MAKALLQTVNSNDQDITENGVIGLGTTSRRYGNCIMQNGNGISIGSEGYYSIDAIVVLTPTAEGNATIVLTDNGTPIPGAIATSSVSTVGNTVTLPIKFTIRRGCNCINTDVISCVLSENSATINNIVTNVEKK